MPPTLVHSPTSPVPMPPDTLMALHDRNVRSFSEQILRAVAAGEAAYTRADCVMDALPCGLEAVRANPLSEEACARLHTFAEELVVITAKLKDATQHIRKCQVFGTGALERFEQRLAELRASDAPHALGDESTAYDMSAEAA